MAVDIINSIMDALTDPDEGFRATMNAGLVTTDPLYLKTFTTGPLQDDPTTRATYLCIMPDVDMTDPEDFYRMPVNSIRRGKLGTGQEVPTLEVGGGLRFINFFAIDGWAPQASSRDEAYTRGQLFLRRAELALFRLQRTTIPAGIFTDDEAETTEGLVQMYGYDGGRCTLTGGDTEWYGKVRMRFHVYSELRNWAFDGTGL